MSLFCPVCGAITRNKQPGKMTKEEMEDYNKKVMIPFNRLEESEHHYYFKAYCFTCGTLKVKKVRLMKKDFVEEKNLKVAVPAVVSCSNSQELVISKETPIQVEEMRIETKSELECLKEELKASCSITEKPIERKRSRNANLLGIKKP